MADGPYVTTIDSAATYVLAPESSDVDDDGSGGYTALITGEGTREDDDPDCSTSFSWELAQARREPAIRLELDPSTGAWHYRPEVISPTEVDSSGQWSMQCDGLDETEPWLGSTQRVLGFLDGGTSELTGALVDTNADPARLVGTTTWTESSPPSGFESELVTMWDTYTYTVTYDLTQVDV